MASTREKQKSEKRRADARRRDKEFGGDYVPTSFKVPEGMKLFKLKERKHRLDFVEYEVGKGQYRGQKVLRTGANPSSGGPNPYVWRP
mgnify:FL=1